MSIWAITTYQKLGGLNHRNFIFHSCGDWKSNIRVLTWLSSGEASLSGILIVAFSLCVHMAFPWHVSMEMRERKEKREERREREERKEREKERHRERDRDGVGGQWKVQKEGEVLSGASFCRGIDPIMETPPSQLH